MKNEKWYIISGFSCKDIYLLNQILTCFLDNSDSILFKHYFFKLDNVDKDFRHEVIEFNFEGYCEKTIKFKSKEIKLQSEKIVLDILFNKLYKRKEEYSKLIERYDEIIDFLYKEKIDIDSHTLDEIKEIISKSISEEYDPKIVEFVKGRERFVNSEDVSFRKTNSQKLDCSWYKLKNSNEILDALAIEDFFECIVTNDLHVFSNFDYAFEFFEWNDNCLAINDRVGNFKNEILPKISMILSDKRFVIEEEAEFRNRCKQEEE